MTRVIVSMTTFRCIVASLPTDNKHVFVSVHTYDARSHVASMRCLRQKPGYD
jgi:hypothetical protein